MTTVQPPLLEAPAPLQAPQHIPWVEKYRPSNFTDIVLDKYNKRIMETILETNHFPNMLLYGPPGTGKTTTIINVVHSFQKKHNQHNKGLLIHLNASDERGIDIIRNQIYQFVNSHSLFEHGGTKFVILDEVDYMTKSAQQALKYLLQGLNNNVRFCLICNYISRIDESLQDEFMRLRFNQLPEADVIAFLSVINDKEQLGLAPEKLQAIQRLYKSDLRSMINYMQSNQNVLKNQKVIDRAVWQRLTKALTQPQPSAAAAAAGASTSGASEEATAYTKSIKLIDSISHDYNLELRHLLKDYFNYLIRDQTAVPVTPALLDLAETIMHIGEPRNEFIKRHVVLSLSHIFKELGLKTFGPSTSKKCLKGRANDDVVG
jgi:replication factor C subunit 3/5